MTAIIGILSLLAAIAGWYYLFYSRAAGRLGGIEQGPANTLRMRLRRVGGVAMLLLAVLFFAGFQEWVEDRVRMYVAVWLAVLFLLLAIVALGLIDLRLTWKLRQDRRRGPR